MKYSILFFMLFCLNLSVNAGSKEGCARFHDGKFKIEEAGTVAYIERKGNKQIETIPSAGQKIELEVIWLDECTYTLRFLRMIEGKNDFPDRGQVVIRCSMGELSEQGYTIRCTSDKYPGMDVKFNVVEDTK